MVIPQPLRLLTDSTLFTQDGLLNSDDFLKAAKRNSDTLSLDDLDRLHTRGILVPLYEIVEEADTNLAVENDSTPGRNTRGHTLWAARQGRLRVPALGNPQDHEPYKRPADADRRWWNGYVYSSWQLNEIPGALTNDTFITTGIAEPVPRPNLSTVVALAALSSRYLPGIVRRLSAPDGMGIDAVQAARRRDPSELLALAAFPPERLVEEADALLFRAHQDPMIGWWPVIRHAGHPGWSKTGGVTRRCLWQRIAAEVLLRAAEDLGEGTDQIALAKSHRNTVWMPLNDRIGRGDEPTLDADLASFGLSPHPKVVLLLEGATEELHFGRLLAAEGLHRPDHVKVIVNGSSKVNPSLLARTVATPRLGTRYETSHHLAAPPTALVVAMDPENDFSSSKLPTTLAKVRDAVRMDVTAQGGEISDQELDHLVRIRSWGTHSYELANFTDDELATAITRLATAAEQPVSDPAWQQSLTNHLAEARRRGKDISYVLTRLQLGGAKVALAEALWPALEARAHTPPSKDDPPVLTLLDDVIALVRSLSAGSYALDATADIGGTQRT